MLPVDVRAVAEHVASCASRFPTVAGAYLFGSVLEEMRPDSDIDVAVVVPPQTHRDLLGVLTLEAKLQSALGQWGAHPFHVTVLDPDRPLFSFRPLCEGRLVYVGHEEVLTDFIEQVARRYSELYPRYRQAVKEVLEG